MYQRLLDMKEDVDALTRQIEQLVNSNESCKRLLAIDGVGRTAWADAFSNP